MSICANLIKRTELIVAWTFESARGSIREVIESDNTLSTRTSTGQAADKATPVGLVELGVSIVDWARLI